MRKNLQNSVHRALVLCATLLGALATQANPTTYNGAGGSGINPVTYTFTATASGDINAYFAGATAGYGSVVGMSVNGGAVGPVGLYNQTANYGDVFDLGAVTAGDIITFILEVNTSGANPASSGFDYKLSSDPSANPDTPSSINHIYSAPYAGDGTIPAGIYVGFEDILAQDNPDYDYDDHQFVFTNVSAAPDGGSTAALIGAAAFGMAALRRKQK